MLQEFNHINFGRMRVIIIDNKPWFLALDSYKVTGVDSRWIRYAVDDCDQSRINKHTIGIKGKCPTNVIVLNERGICAFVRRYAGANARPYIQWIHEIAQQSVADMEPKPVLSDEAKLLKKIIASPDFGIALLTEIKNERNRRTEKPKEIDAIVGEFTKWLANNYDNQTA